MMRKVFYLCNGQKDDCQKGNCYRNGGNCRHTSDINHALNFEIKGSYKNGGSFYEKEQNEANEMKKPNIYEEISAFAKRQRDEIKKEKKIRKKQVCIDPDSIIGKEIMYQTALLHEILNEVRKKNRVSKSTEEKMLVIRIKGHQECLNKIKELKEETEQLNKLMRESVELQKSLGI